MGRTQRTGPRSREHPPSSRAADTAERALSLARDLIGCRYAHFSAIGFSGAGAAEPRLWETPPDLITRALTNRGLLLDVLTDSREGAARMLALAAFLAGLLRRSLEEINQFQEISVEADARLTDRYARMLEGCLSALSAGGTEKVFTERLRQVMRRHFLALAPVVAALAGDAGEVVCAMYSPALQLGILGLDADPPASPILDLGCGPSGDLVHALRADGLEAWGVDRHAAGLPYLAAADWYRAPLPRSFWGTVVSHQAFSLHFIHHHLNPAGRPADYAALFRRILLSLKPGGSFVYAPGLPFVESCLPDGYDLQRRRLPVMRLPVNSSKINKDISQFRYAARIRRQC